MLNNFLLINKSFDRQLVVLEGVVREISLRTFAFSSNPFWRVGLRPYLYAFVAVFNYGKPPAPPPRLCRSSGLKFVNSLVRANRVVAPSQQHAGTTSANTVDELTRSSKRHAFRTAKEQNSSWIWGLICIHDCAGNGPRAEGVLLFAPVGVETRLPDQRRSRNYPTVSSLRRFSPDKTVFARTVDKVK